MYIIGNAAYMMWHVARMDEIRKAYRIFCSENLKGRNHSEDLVVVGRIILKWILGKFSGSG
jgi:hypothetical protein